MRIRPLALALGLIISAGRLSQMAGDAPLLGFIGDRAAGQRALEAKFDAQLRADNLREWMKRLTARPHHVGSPFGKDVADFIAAQFRQWGYATRIEEFHVLFPTPRTRLVELVGPRRFTATLEEPAMSEDATSSQRREQLPPYNAYSIDGDVTGPLVYVNYGVPDDYEVLERRGIDVKGKIVIARYGGSWRGIKPKVAAERGASGCIIYSDPADDGFVQGDVYPRGAYRNNFGVQRGSVADMPLYAGDPLTPNIGATKQARRLSREEALTLTKIPVLPIAYADAQPLLAALDGPVAPAAWRGGLPITYHLGPGPATVHLKVESNWDLAPVYNVIATLEGRERPDQWIIRGNHHDAWVNGARDPISGLVALMEEARVVGELARSGWWPKRTIIFAAWDAEEPGLLGSTEWAELHAAELREHTVAYVNTDNNGRGFLGMSGSHTLEQFINEVARDVPDPQTGVSVSERLHARRLVTSRTEEDDARRDHRITALGSGSDYTPFLQHLGIASLDLRYEGEGEGGSYHSIYDSFDHYVRFGDPTFEYGVALTKTTGRAVLRLAEADLLPFEFEAFHATFSRYLDDVIRVTDDMRRETDRHNRLVEERRHQIAADPKQTYVPPQTRSPVPYLNVAPVQNALTRLQRAARSYGEAFGRVASGERTLSVAEQRSLDAVLLKTERALTRDEGLPRRPWFTHQIYAPGFYTGYGVKTLPGVREAIEQREWEVATRQLVVLAETVQRFAGEIDRATAIINGSLG